MVNPGGKLEKLLLRSFKGPKLEPNDLLGEFEVFINPENYSQEYSIEYNREQGDGTSASPQGFQRIPPQEMTFEFLFDRTGVLPDSPPQDRGVMPDIERLKELTYEYNGEIHRPPYLTVTWGELYFQCVLSSLNIQYKLFRSDATPIRATVRCAFKEFKDEELRTREENDESPDLTHLRVVKEGDTLPLLAYRIYGDPKYYLAVARVNRLVDFKQLPVGTQLVFPPLEK